MTRSVVNILLLIGLVGGVVIEPQNPVVRHDQTTRLMCKVRGPIKSCLWEVNGELYNVAPGSKYQPVGVLQDGECGVQATMTEAENGQWTCRVFVEGGDDRAERASTNVTILSLPQITLTPDSDPITVTAGESVDIQCVVNNARPIPAISWMIGDQEISTNNRHNNVVPTRDGKATITDTLRYAFQAGNHDQTLRCLTSGPWLTVDDPHYAVAHLNVIFPPQPKEPVTLYGFVLGQPGDVTLNFTANPRPFRVSWKVDDTTELPVEPFQPRPANDRYEVAALGMNLTNFDARLRIKSVTEADARRRFTLNVESEVNGEVVRQDYEVRISTSAAPLQSGGVGGGGIAAIIIVLIAVLVITAVVLYARNTGRWCFAGRRRTVGEGESQARIDEENPGEIIKEKEGKDGPLKSSNENLNLQLATNGQQEAGTENGNAPPTPVKEAQQQNGGGNQNADGKDTAV